MANRCAEHLEVRSSVRCKKRGTGGVRASWGLTFVLRGRGGCRLDQLACGRRRADNVPAFGAGRTTRGRRRNQRSRPASSLPWRRMAYSPQVARRTPTMAVVAPRHKRLGWAGGGAVAGLDERSQLLVSRAVACVWRHGPLRFGTVALPPRLPGEPRARDKAVAARGGCRVRRCHLRRLLRGWHRHLDDQ